MGETAKVTLDSPREDIVKAWLARLRDPKSKQAKNWLRVGSGRCCLGHLCEVVGIKSKRLTTRWYYEQHSKDLPDNVRRAAGLRTSIGAYTTIDIDEPDTLSVLNDHGRSLSEIADIIESRPPGLFVDEPTPSPSPDQ